MYMCVCEVPLRVKILLLSLKFLQNYTQTNKKYILFRILVFYYQFQMQSLKYLCIHICTWLFGNKWHKPLRF